MPPPFARNVRFHPAAAAAQRAGFRQFNDTVREVFEIVTTNRLAEDQSVLQSRCSAPVQPGSAKA